MPRHRAETLQQLRSQFIDAQRVGGQSSVEKARTRTGVKDTFQSFFIDKLCSITTKRGQPRTDKEAAVQDYLKTIPYVEESATSPVWRIRGTTAFSSAHQVAVTYLCAIDFDPHSDTPIEILHVVLLGFVKYFWRDTVSRLSDSGKKTLITRLSSFDVTGLGISPLSGNTLVTYAGSLVGRDFRAIAQVASFVLYDLSGIPPELQNMWITLSQLVPLVWQPEINDLPAHLIRLSESIDLFLEATCNLTPRWFNKPKFYLILHLPRHIRRFGPAILFATEGFESFNAVIRSHSVHSNHRAPSRDIALGMARHNRLRHILSGGYFTFPRIVNGKIDEELPDLAEGTPGVTKKSQSRWLLRMAYFDHDKLDWRMLGSGPLSLLEDKGFSSKIVGLPSRSADDGNLPGKRIYSVQAWWLTVNGRCQRFAVN
ncbi:hypothetical protein BN946_scf185000.g74 [Trametes cinnabarina]|uniref:Uncharacterized protein n=1 Tax=Pycnoporus cinnabarinus TaxID=5643 RepID=A0A060S439_PYCCI|nr:hypothetical protein BN946_scf185000.g74 [Trametes cinnabarina]